MSDLDDLAEKIHKAEHRHDPTPAEIQAAKDAENKKIGLQAGVEFTGSILVGIALGLALDHWLGTKPVFFMLLFFLGIFTGFFNVYRVTQNIGSAVGFAQQHKELQEKEKGAKTSPDLDKTDSEKSTEKD